MSAKIPFPYEFRDLPPGQDKAVKNGLYAPVGGLIQVGPENLAIPATFAEIANDVYNFEPRKDDVWLAGYPRSGTTVTQELVWLVANDMDFNGAKEPLAERFPFLEFNTKNEQWKNIIPKLEQMKSKRFIKTHMTYSLLHPSLFTKGSKVIYVARNPKDVIVSNYHVHRFFTLTDGSVDFPTFFDYFYNDCVIYSPYFEHVLQGWEHRHRENYLFLFYEDFRKDPETTIRKVAKFLDKTPTDTQINELIDHLDLKNFKKNPSINRVMVSRTDENETFVRKGEVGNWTNYFTKEMNEKIDQRIREKYDPVGLKFVCENAS